MVEPSGKTSAGEDAGEGGGLLVKNCHSFVNSATACELLHDRPFGRAAAFFSDRLAERGVGSGEPGEIIRLGSIVVEGRY